MRRNLIIYTSICLIAFFSALSFNQNSREAVKPTTEKSLPDYDSTVQSTSEEKQAVFSTIKSTKDTSIEKPAVESTVIHKESAVKTVVLASNRTITTKKKDTIAAVSRGGSISKSVQNTSKSTSSTSGVLLLDWWKEGRKAFPIGSVAVVKDVNTGKTFKIKRTMGSNHADCEAVSKSDTDIIKSIWGGFNWTTRPIILNIGGKRYAASMSSLPHAGVDSASFGAVVNNRSEGYGRGQNLDSIKNNGMNGHFDVHFLNSTRHKDGKEDPKHQASVMKAAK